MADNDPIKDDAARESSPSNKDRELDALRAEAELAIRNTLAGEQAKDLRQRRTARQIGFWLLAGLAVISGAMVVALGFAIYSPDCWIFGRSALRIFIKNGSFWPLGVLISGTFISFVAVFGALAFGVFSSAKGRR